MHAAVDQALPDLRVHQHRLVGDLQHQHPALDVFQAQRAGRGQHRLHRPGLLLEIHVDIAGVLRRDDDVHRLVEVAGVVAVVSHVGGGKLFATGIGQRRLGDHGCGLLGRCLGDFRCGLGSWLGGAGLGRGDRDEHQAGRKGGQGGEG